jgi:hypothetical protein
MPELRRRRQGELPPLHLHRQDAATPRAAASRSARSRRAQLRARRGRDFLAHKKIGRSKAFRSKAGWPFTAELKLAFDDEIKNWKLEFDFGEDAKKDGESGEPVDFSGQESLGACPKCQGHVYELGSVLRLRAQRSART